MSVWIRRTGITLAVLLIVLAVATTWLVTRFDPADYKGVAIDWVKTHRHRTLEIDGPIRLSVLPRLEIRLAEVRLSEAGKPDLFASIDEVSLAAELLPLLRGRLLVDRVDARGVRVVFLRDAKGRRNVDNLLQATPPAGPQAGTPLQFDVQRIVLVDVQARVKDELAGVDGELVLKELSTGRIASQVESSLRLVAQLGFKTPGLKGELSGSTRFTPDFSSASLRLSEMDLAYKGDAPGASSIDATLEGALGWDGAQGSLQANALTLKFSASTAGMRLADSSLGVARFALEPARKSFAISQLQLRIKGSQGAHPLTLELDWPELDVSGKSLTGSALAGKFSYGAELPVAATFKSDAPSGNFDNVRVPSFEARLSSDAASRKLSGKLRSELVLQPEKRAAVLDRIELQLALEAAGLKPLNLALRGHATLTPKMAGWTLAGDVNANRFNTEGSASFVGSTPQVQTLLGFESLDLNALLAPAQTGAAGSGREVPIDLAALRRLNGSFGIRLGSLALRQYRFNDVGLDAVLDAGMLRVSNLHAKAWGGSIDGSAFADARASRVALKATAEGVDIQALLKDVADKTVLEGTGRIDVDIESAGRTATELKARLKGGAALTLRDGAVTGINLARALRQAKAALSLKQDAVVKASSTEKTDFSELSASFRIDAGVARSNDLELNSPYLRVAGEGAVDNVKGRLDSSVRATLADTAKGQDSAEPAVLKGIMVPVQWSGPFEALDWKIQWSGVDANAVKNQARAELERRLKEKPAPRQAPKAPAPAASRPSLEDRAKNRVKGLVP